MSGFSTNGLPSSVLITGANGFLGAALARALLSAGCSVRCLVRPNSDRSPLAGLEQTIVAGDVCEPESLKPALSGVKVVFHLAGIRRATVRDEFMKTNVDGTRFVAQAMVESGARRLVFCGSLAASGPATRQHPKTESEPFAPAEWYGESKALAESVAFSFGEQLEVTSIRPARILGPLDKENLPFFRLAKRGLVFKIAGPPRELSLVDVDDVVRQLLIQSHSPKAVGESFFCASPETMTIEAMMRAMAQSFGVNVKLVPVFPLGLTLTAKLADQVSNLSGRKLPLNSKLAKQLLAPGWCCSVEKAASVLGFTAQTSLAESLRRSAQSYAQAGLL